MREQPEKPKDAASVTDADRHARNPRSDAQIEDGKALNESTVRVLCEEIGFMEVRAVISDFIADLPDMMRGLERHAADGHLAELGRAAHSLKAVAASFGLDALAMHLGAIEEAAEGLTVPSSTLLQRAVALSVEAAHGLRGWLAGQTSGDPR